MEALHEVHWETRPMARQLPKTKGESWAAQKLTRPKRPE